MFCHFCGMFLGVLHLGYFCPDCAYLRRLYLLHDPKEFLDKVRAVFLYPMEASRAQAQPPEASGSEEGGQRRKKN